jgi:hypothetical protein
LPGNQTRATLILEIDLKGSLPQWAIAKANVEQGSQLNLVPKAIDRYLLENNIVKDY